MATPEGPGSSRITVPESVTIDHASFDKIVEEAVRRALPSNNSDNDHTNNEDTQANSGKSFSFLLSPISSTLRGCEQLLIYKLEGYVIVGC